MANLSESSNFTPGIYQLETIDPVQGGAGGISNLQAQQLANRTRFLNDQITALTNLVNGLTRQLAGEVIVLPYEIPGTANLWTSPDGWLYYRPRGASIGSAASLATVADNRVEALFKALWATPAYTMGGGLPKGASADADWAANRVLLIPDMRGRALAMAGTATGGTANRAVGAVYGSETTQLAVANLPVHSHRVSMAGFTATGLASSGATGVAALTFGANAIALNQINVTGNRSAASDGLGAIGDTGSGTAFSVADPTTPYSVVWACGVRA